MLNEFNAGLPVMFKPKLCFFPANKQCRFSRNPFLQQSG